MKASNEAFSFATRKYALIIYRKGLITARNGRTKIQSRPACDSLCNMAKNRYSIKDCFSSFDYIFRISSKLKTKYESIVDDWQEMCV